MVKSLGRLADPCSGYTVAEKGSIIIILHQEIAATARNNIRILAGMESRIGARHSVGIT